MRNDRLVIAQPEIGQRLYGALAVPPVWEGALEERARVNILGEDLTLPEFWFLRGGRSLGFTVTVIGVAAQVSIVQMLPDPSTATLFIIDEVLVGSAASVQVFAGFGIQTAGLPSFQPVAMDDGNPAVVFPGSISAMALSAGTNGVAPSVGNAVATIAPATAPYAAMKGPWIIRKNTPFIIRSVGANQTITVSVKWRERALLDTERARF